jgi:long-chain fatty acid transport protein
VDVRHSWLRVGFTVAGLGFGASEACWGSGFQLRENSAAALGNAFAGAAISADAPSVIANNPAAIIGLSGNQASGDLSIVIPSLIFSGSGFTAARQPIGGGDGGDAGGAQPVPAAYGFYDALPDLKFGLAVSVPFGLATQYDNGWVGRYQAIKSRIEAININPVLAYRVSDWLAVGGGPAVQRLDTD